MNKDLFDRIVDALLPDMDDPAARKALVESALFGSSVLHKIQWDGAARSFTARLTRQLDEYGNITAGKPALVALVEELRGQVGADRQRQIDELIASLQARPAAQTVVPPVAPTDNDLHIFISYARKDGTAYCERLYDQLSAQQYSVWRDTRDLDPFTSFDAEIEHAIEQATHLVVIITPDVKRENSFVRLEIAYALMHHKRIIPLLFPGGHRPITILNNTYIDFADWDRGYGELLARHTGGLVHLKTAGTSYLEALRLMASVNPALFRQVLDFSRGRYEADRKTYHVSAALDNVPDSAALSDAQLPDLLNQFDARQVMHVTFGSVLDHFGAELRLMLHAYETEYHVYLRRHFARHLAPFKVAVGR